MKTTLVTILLISLVIIVVMVIRYAGHVVMYTPSIIGNKGEVERLHNQIGTQTPMSIETFNPQEGVHEFRIEVLNKLSETQRDQMVTEKTWDTGDGGRLTIWYTGESQQLKYLTHLYWDENMEF